MDWAPEAWKGKASTLGDRGAGCTRTGKSAGFEVFGEPRET